MDNLGLHKQRKKRLVFEFVPQPVENLGLQLCRGWVQGIVRTSVFDFAKMGTRNGKTIKNLGFYFISFLGFINFPYIFLNKIAQTPVIENVICLIAGEYLADQQAQVLI